MMTSAQASTSLVSRHAVRTSCPRLRSNPAKALVPLRLAPRELPYPVSNLRAQPEAETIPSARIAIAMVAGRRDSAVFNRGFMALLLVLSSWTPGGYERPGRETRGI